MLLSSGVLFSPSPVVPPALIPPEPFPLLLFPLPPLLLFPFTLPFIIVCELLLIVVELDDEDEFCVIESPLLPFALFCPFSPLFPLSAICIFSSY